ncbi:Ectonucleotide pyrophosphatase/phosphodiesterase family member 6 [Orchesella cincta]|uniref:Ectonucleotide pyrophosphatase/phosphodiesterase family member 6 n=1 Tax=Orchesella cincta TaxID=48709 RepID=A0A1D2MU78_ORCCI|nr:Ectonucleotide pyrophosphatase/phosphodiesterase family member 6 [Orchesella cincta]
MKELNRGTWNIRLVLLVIFAMSLLCELPSVQARRASKSKKRANEKSPKLLVIMLDGWRWDYYDRQKDELPAFSKFLQEGVQAKWVEPVFPSISYPSWTTISTGVYPEVHGILSNYMFDQHLQAVFDYKNNTSVSMEHWWQNAEPIWITATRHGRKALLNRWSRCDVPFDGIKPETCVSYDDVVDGTGSTVDAFRIAVESLQQDYDLVMIYIETIDLIGHEYGPDSPELMEAVRHIDSALSFLLGDMQKVNIDDKVNTIIIGDHGMKALGESAKIVYLNDYINVCDIYKIVGKGPIMTIEPYAQTKVKVYQALQYQEGFDVYLREEIPEDFHYKNGKLVLELLIVAHPNYYLSGFDSDKQIPENLVNASDKIEGGIHGYPDNITEMRTIFYAKGPGFKNGLIHPPIKMVDLYQIFTYLLDIPSRPNNGSWARVSEMFSSARETVSNFWMVTFSICLINLV